MGTLDARAGTGRDRFLLPYGTKTERVGGFTFGRDGDAACWVNGLRFGGGWVGGSKRNLEGCQHNYKKIEKY